MKIVVALVDRIGQRLDEFGIRWSGGDPHVVGLGGEIEGRPNRCGENDGAKDRDEPGVAQEHPDAIAHHVFKQPDIHALTRRASACFAAPAESSGKPKSHG